MSRIVRLEAENVKRIKVMRIDAGGKSVIIGGKNGAGKTSAIDVVQYLFGGKREWCARMVRDGQDKASAEVLLDSGLKVRGEWTPDGRGRVTLTSADGLKASNPQTILDTFVGDLSFDPLEFDRMTPAERAAALSRITGLDTSDLDADDKSYRGERTLVGRDIDNAGGYYESLPEYPGAEPVDVSDLLRQQSAARESERTAEGASREAASLGDAVKAAAVKIGEAEGQIAKWQAALKDRRVQLEGIEKNHAAAVAKRAEAAASVIDAAPIAEAIRTAGEANARVQANAAKAKANGALDALRVKYNGLTEKIHKLAEQKASRIAAVKMPIDGLAIAGNDVTMNGVPWNQCSSAERLEAEVALGFAANPKLRVVLIRDGSLLDDEHLARVVALAEKHDGQCLIEVVGERGDCSVIIEDGSVKVA